MKLEERLKRFAEVNGLNFVKDVDMLKALERNEQRHGVAVCPCAYIAPGCSVDFVLDCVCPCKIGMELLEDRGSCTCGLFEKRIPCYEE